MFFGDCESGSVASFGVRGTTRMLVLDVFQCWRGGCPVCFEGCGSVCVIGPFDGVVAGGRLSSLTAANWRLRTDTCWMGPVRGFPTRASALGVIEYEKGIWWMPWRQEAMKDVARCENLGGAASRR